MKQYILAISLAFLLGACGGEESSEDTISEPEINETPVGLTGTFIDATVEGLGYRCHTGAQLYTDINGHFTCVLGENVQFNLGALILESIAAQEGIISPYSLYPNDRIKALRLAQLLQSIDADSQDGHILLNASLVRKIPASLDFLSDTYEEEMQALLGLSLKPLDEVKVSLDTSLNDLGIMTPNDNEDNHTPIANAGEDREVRTLAEVTLSGELSSDSDEDELNYAWTLTSPDGNTILANENTVNPSFTADVDGEYVATLIVNDGQAFSLADSIIITASKLNHTPIANAGVDKNAQLNDLVHLSGLLSSDVDNDALSFEWTLKSPSNADVIMNNAETARPSFDALEEGIYVASLIVNDGAILSLIDTVEINVLTAGAQNQIFLDPLNGDNNNDGSLSNPLSSLASVLTSGRSFDDNLELVLMSGNHGKIEIENLNPNTRLSFVALENNTPIFSELQMKSSSKLVFKGITVDGSHSQLSRDNFMIIGDVNTNNISFDKMTIKAADDSSTWLKDDWYANSIGGMDMRGNDISVTNSLITNVYHAVSLRGNNSYYAHNVIDNFAGDGIRGLGDDSVYEYNTVRDCYIDDYDIQHDDGFQAFRVAADGNYKIKNVTLRGNKILLFEDPITDFVRDNNLVGTLMQGMIITDGHADSWIVENNLVVNAQYHGISLYGASSCRVQNNTVVSHPDFPKDKAPRVYLDDQKKSGQEHSNTDNIIRNNITTTLATWTFDESSTVENNIDIVESTLSNFTDHFVDYENYDFHLKSTSAAVDAGVNTDITSLDNDELPRLQNTTVDIGALEYR